MKRLKTADAAALYAGHEIASHTLIHPYMESMTKKELLHELAMDKANLGKIFGKEIRGFAVPFDFQGNLQAAWCLGSDQGGDRRLPEGNAQGADSRAIHPE